MQCMPYINHISSERANKHGKYLKKKHTTHWSTGTQPERIQRKMRKVRWAIKKKQQRKHYSEAQWAQCMHLSEFENFEI